MPFKINPFSNRLDEVSDTSAPPADVPSAITSAIINFKTVGVTTLFTTPAGSRFAPAFVQYVCESATAANGNGGFSVGWTAAAYSDYILAESFNPTTANMCELYQTGSSQVKVFPANTAIKINITGADTGTALTGRLVFYGVYI
jgi:hypothetical protein